MAFPKPNPEAGRHSEHSGGSAFSSSATDLRTALKLGIAQLRDAQVPSDTLNAELLLLHATSRTRTDLYSHPESELTSEQLDLYLSLLGRRAAGIPLQHLTGKQEFWGLEFEVTPDVLIPRPETEHVVEVALDRLALRDLRNKHAQNMSGEGLLIADVGTGSGCIAIALAKELPAAAIHALDISSAALAVAQRNATRLGFANRIAFHESNLLSALSVVGAQHAAPSLGNQSVFGPRSPAAGRGSMLFDLIVSNPPYIGRREAPGLQHEVRDHEPAIALYGGEEGYEFYAELISQSAQHLKPGGLLVLELGHNSLPAVQPLFDSPLWMNLGVTNDLAAIPRVIAAERAHHD
jgi:release factor glutamine methyltransferase